MFKRSLTLSLIGALIFSLSAAPTTFANSKAEKDAQLAAKVKAGIAKLGSGPDARIEVKLRDKNRLKGYVSQIGDESFAVADAKTGATTEVPYSNVASVTGTNVPTGAKIAIGVGIGVGLTFLILYLVYLANES